jgi:hypothetical protein
MKIVLSRKPSLNAVIVCLGVLIWHMQFARLLPLNYAQILVL